METRLNKKSFLYLKELGFEINVIVDFGHPKAVPFMDPNCRS
jgi:hypothetical protein